MVKLSEFCDSLLEITFGLKGISLIDLEGNDIFSKFDKESGGLQNKKYQALMSQILNQNYDSISPICETKFESTSFVYGSIKVIISKLKGGSLFLYFSKDSIVQDINETVKACKELNSIFDQQK